MSSHVQNIQNKVCGNLFFNFTSTNLPNHYTCLTILAIIIGKKTFHFFPKQTHPQVHRPDCGRCSCGSCNSRLWASNRRASFRGQKPARGPPTSARPGCPHPPTWTGQSSLSFDRLSIGIIQCKICRSPIHDMLNNFFSIQVKSTKCWIVFFRTYIP